MNIDKWVLRFIWLVFATLFFFDWVFEHWRYIPDRYVTIEYRDAVKFIVISDSLTDGREFEISDQRQIAKIVSVLNNLSTHWFVADEYPDFFTPYKIEFFPRSKGMRAVNVGIGGMAIYGMADARKGYSTLYNIGTGSPKFPYFNKYYTLLCPLLRNKHESVKCAY